MPLILTMPKLSPTMDEGTIVKWRKQIEELVEAGEVLMEVATDKATVEYQAIDTGWLRKILVEEGNMAHVNQPIAIFTEEQNENLEGFEVPTIKPSSSPKTESEEPQLSENVSAEQTPTKPRKGSSWQQPDFIPEPPLETTTFPFPTQSLEPGKRILVSPLAKRLAQERGLDLSTVKGTGPNGRIMSRDLEKAQPTGWVTFGRRESPQIPAGSYEEQSLSPMRKVIGQRLQESKSFIPHFYVQQTIDAESLIQIREQLKRGNIKVSINDLIVRGCALALKQHPQVNAGYYSVNQSIILFKTIDIAIAVSIEGGLITPIVRHADYKNLGELAVEIRELVQRARQGKLEPQEYKGGSFTISNLGMYGVTDFQAIINPPQAAILAVSGIQEVPTIKNGQILAGKLLNLTLSVDHRVIDGVAAALFLKTLKDYLENPVLLLI